jgi:tetratricopeptide (TPR) repeat protein
MPKSSARAFAMLALAATAAACQPDSSGAVQAIAPGSAGDPAGSLAGLVSNLEAGVDEEHVVAVAAVVEQAADAGAVLQLLAHYAYLSRHLDLATWLYARAAQAAPDEPSNWSNLGLGLTEIAMRDGDADGGVAELALLALREAERLAPESAAVQNNLGVALQKVGAHPEAGAAFSRAIDLEPTTSLFHAHLGEVYAAQGRDDEAGAAFARAHRLDPFDGVLLRIVAEGGPLAASYAAAPRDYCDTIDYDCMRSCPGGIIGRLNAVTCEMAQASAILSCREGAAYAEDYDCNLDLRSIPFLLPGMFPGLSVVTPVGRLDVLLQGNGAVDFSLQLTGPAGLGLTTSGRYDPQTGVSLTQLAPGVGANLYNRGHVAPALSSYGVNPTALKHQRDFVGGRGTTTIESYGTSIFHLH